MVDLTLILEGTSPLLMHNPRMMDPEFAITREIKEITSKRKKTDEDMKRIEKLEWRGALYEGDDGTVIYPTANVRKCLINAAKLHKLGKAIERSVSVLSLSVPLIHDGPKLANDLAKDDRYRNRASVGISGRRVMRVRPQFNVWSVAVDVQFVDTIGLNIDELENIVKLAGVVEGLGDNRVNGYGRFNGRIRKNGK